MSEHLNARDLSPKEGSGSFSRPDFNPFTQSSASDFSSRDRDRATENSAIGGATSNLFPNAQELLNSLRQGQHEDRHSNETMPLGTVPYPDDTKSNKNKV
jgi:hypothetical protein